MQYNEAEFMALIPHRETVKGNCCWTARWLSGSCYISSWSWAVGSLSKCIFYAGWRAWVYRTLSCPKESTQSSHHATITIPSTGKSAHLCQPIILLNNPLCLLTDAGQGITFSVWIMSKFLSIWHTFEVFSPTLWLLDVLKIVLYFLPLCYCLKHV